MLNTVITKRYKTYTVKQRSADTYVKGKLTINETSTTMQLTILPVNLKDIKDAPEGVYDMGDIKIYHAGDKTIADGSTVVFDGDTYEIKGLVNRQYGDYALYVGKARIK